MVERLYAANRFVYVWANANAAYAKRQLPMIEVAGSSQFIYIEYNVGLCYLAVS